MVSFIAKFVIIYWNQVRTSNYMKKYLTSVTKYGYLFNIKYQIVQIKKYHNNIYLKVIKLYFGSLG